LKNSISALLLAAGVLTTAAGTVRKEVPLPEYTVLRAPGPIRVDGRLSEAGWQAAPRLSSFYTWDGGSAEDLTVCRMLWDDRYLYIAFECQDQDVVAKGRRRDEPLYATDDVVEAFLDPVGDLRHYAEVIVNPRGVLFDAYQVTNEAGDAPAISLLDWDMRDVKVAVRVQGSVREPNEPKAAATGWTVELAVPFSSFPWQVKPPEEGSVWRAALTRYDRPDPAEGDLQHYAWSPPYRQGWPHIVDRFGRLIFSGQRAVEKK
jgi:hypothetical protein